MPRRGRRAALGRRSRPGRQGRVPAAAAKPRARTHSSQPVLFLIIYQLRFKGLQNHTVLATPRRGDLSKGLFCRDACVCAFKPLNYATLAHVAPERADAEERLGVIAARDIRCLGA